MNEDKTIDKKVHSTAHLFDCLFPGWYNDVSTCKLDMRHGSDCVGGQIARTRKLHDSSQEFLSPYYFICKYLEDYLNLHTHLIGYMLGLSGDPLLLGKLWLFEINSRRYKFWPIIHIITFFNYLFMRMRVRYSCRY